MQVIVALGRSDSWSGGRPRSMEAKEFGNGDRNLDEPSTPTFQHVCRTAHHLLKQNHNATHNTIVGGAEAIPTVDVATNQWPTRFIEQQQSMVA